MVPRIRLRTGIVRYVLYGLSLPVLLHFQVCMVVTVMVRYALDNSIEYLSEMVDIMHFVIFCCFAIVYDICHTFLLSCVFNEKLYLFKSGVEVRSGLVNPRLKKWFGCLKNCTIVGKLCITGCYAYNSFCIA